MTIISWNGSDVPEELHKLPAGRYVVMAVDEFPVLTSEQEAGIAQALSSLRNGDGIDHQLVKERVAAKLMR